MSRKTGREPNRDRIRELNTALGRIGRAGYLTERRLWVIEWTMGQTDPFTGENHQTTYRSFAEAMRAANSAYG